MVVRGDAVPVTWREEHCGCGVRPAGGDGCDWWFEGERRVQARRTALVLIARKSCGRNGDGRTRALIVSVNDTPAWRVIPPPRVNIATECTRRGVLHPAFWHFEGRRTRSFRSDSPVNGSFLYSIEGSQTDVRLPTHKNGMKGTLNLPARE